MTRHRVAPFVLALSLGCAALATFAEGEPADRAGRMADRLFADPAPVTDGTATNGAARAVPPPAAAAWTNVEQRVEAVEKRVQSLAAQVGDAPARVGAYNTVEKRVADLEKQVSRLETDVRKMEQRLRKLETQRR